MLKPTVVDDYYAFHKINATVTFSGKVSNLVDCWNYPNKDDLLSALPVAKLLPRTSMCFHFHFSTPMCLHFHFSTSM